MSLLLRTITAFPSGRTTGELLALLDIDFDPRKRTEIYAELDRLVEAGSISKGRDGKWRLSARTSNFRRPEDEKKLSLPLSAGEVLTATPATFQSSVAAASSLGGDEFGEAFDASAMLRYYRSTLRADPRGAISQIADRHGIQWQLISGLGPLTPDEGHLLTIRVALDDLADEFRKALLKREANEQALAIGWPIAVGRKQGAPVVWPVGLVSGDWKRTETHLEILVDADDVLVNPDWLKGAARQVGWTEGALRDVFQQQEGLGLERDEFLARLKEAAAGSFRGRVTGRSMLSEVDPYADGIFDLAGLFLPTDNTFTAGAARDLDAISAWSVEKLSRTALSSILGIKPNLDTTLVPVINVGDLNKEQIAAVRLGTSQPLTVVTGPPGTGKSQAIVSIVASTVAEGGTVLVASKNHQALDAVQERLESLSSEVRFLVRTLDPAREIDQSFDTVLAALVNEPSRGGGEPDLVARSRLANVANRRIHVLDQIDVANDLNLQIAVLLERIEARMAVEPPPSAQEQRTVVQESFAARIMHLIWRVLRRKAVKNLATTNSDENSLSALQRDLESCRRQLDKLDLSGDPVALTTEIAELVKQVLPRLLKGRVSISEDERLKLGEDLANLELANAKGSTPSGLASEVVSHRPLWLASVLGAPRRIPLVEGLFDLVIVDEASQCDIASALPLFARAKRAVVVGDSHQLSFISQLGIAHDRNLMQAQGLEPAGLGKYAQSRRSLFDLANLTTGASKVMLRNQYRSAAAIVGYINDQFYGGRLRVASDENRMKVPKGAKPGLAWTDVQAPAAAMQGNINPAEVSAIVAELRRLLVDQRYSGTVGVIAPFRPQVAALAEAITTAIPEDLLQTAEFRAGTVDSFQGQERDLILFSPCLGGSSAMSAVTFVQRDWRRMNVAISRARAIAHVFGDLGYARSGKVTSLQRLAQAATEPKPRVAEGTFDSGWEYRVYEELKARGFAPIPQFEVAGRRLDFALFGSGDIKLDLEIDGRHWHSDADGKRKLADHWRDHQLKSLGWRVRRFWVDELAKDLEKCLDLVRTDLS
jgi:very-short-patch-repair endonuclease